MHIDRTERICAAEYLLRDICQLLGTLSLQEAYLMPGFASATDPECASQLIGAAAALRERHAMLCSVRPLSASGSPGSGQ